MILIKSHEVKGIDKGVRLSDYATGLFEELPTKSSVKKAIKTGHLQIEDGKTNTGCLLHEGMKLLLYEAQDSPPKPYHLKLEVIYQDQDLAIVNKPSGLPTSGNQFRTLENALVDQLSLPGQSKYLKWPKPVHRLDSLTSGLVLVAKTIESRYILGQAFESRRVFKTYHALVMGKTPNKGVLKTKIDEKPAETTYEQIDLIRSLKNQHLSLLKLHPKTGRTHQIRIHCARAGFPVYGDPIYAENTIRHKGLFLAATGLSFIHPMNKKPFEISIDLPPNFYSRLKSEQRRWNKYHPTHEY